jgi:hypothetical protein
VRDRDRDSSVNARRRRAGRAGGVVAPGPARVASRNVRPDISRACRSTKVVGSRAQRSRRGASDGSRATSGPITLTASQSTCAQVLAARTSPINQAASSLRNNDSRNSSTATANEKAFAARRTIGTVKPRKVRSLFR